MIIAADLAVARGALHADARDALVQLIGGLGPLPSIADLRVEDALEAIRHDKKVVDVSKYYNTERLRPIYDFDGAPLFIMTSD